MSTSEWQGWQQRSLTLRYHTHGGPIETEHDVTVFLLVQVAANFHFPEFTEDPQPLAVALDKDTYAYGAMWLKSRLEVRKPVDVADWKHVPVFNFNLDPTMTCPLPSTQAWLDATDNDQDLVQI